MVVGGGGGVVLIENSELCNKITKFNVPYNGKTQQGLPIARMVMIFPF